MSNLDDKLREILEATTKEATPQFIAQIKQVLEEAGWVYAPFNPLATDEDPVSLQKLVNAEHGLMTGAEWYERFEKAYYEVSDPYEPMPEDFWIAAKRASGLEDEA